MTLQEIQYKAQSIICKWRDDDSAPYIEFVEELAHMIVPEPSEDLEEAADNHIRKVVDAGWEWETQDIADAFIAGAKWHADHAPLPEDTVLFNKGVAEGKRLMMEDFPKWRRIKAGERLPCPAYVWTIAYDNYPDCFEGRLMPNIQGVKLGRDTWYLPVDVIHNLPKED